MIGGYVRLQGRPGRGSQLGCGESRAGDRMAGRGTGQGGELEDTGRKKRQWKNNTCWGVSVERRRWQEGRMLTGLEPLIDQLFKVCLEWEVVLSFLCEEQIR